MPLPKRSVSPAHVTRNTLPDKDCGKPNELEEITNGTLANIIRQLSSLSKHAEDMFAELLGEAQNIVQRTNVLQTKVDRLMSQVTQLDHSVEEVSLTDIHRRGVFRSNVLFDQAVVSRESMPPAMKDTYLSCDPPPPLDKFTPYRDDGKDGLKFYTDPNYFFTLWKQEMLRDTKHDKSKKVHHRSRGSVDSGSGSAGQPGRHKKKVRTPQNTREQQKQKAAEKGEILADQIGHSPVIGGIKDYPNIQDIDIRDIPRLTDYAGSPMSNAREQFYNDHLPSSAEPLSENEFHRGSMPMPPPPYEFQQSPLHTGRPSEPPPQPPTMNTSSDALPNGLTLITPPPPIGLSSPQQGPVIFSPPPGYHRMSRGNSVTRDSLPPPPPPPMVSHPVNGGVSMPSGPSRDSLPPPPPSPPTLPTVCSPLPPPPPPNHAPTPPPPPPPPPLPTSPLKVPPSFPNGDVTSRTPVSAAAPPKMGPPRGVDRSDLLQAIREGIQLRKVEQRQQEAKKADPLADVASILQRRVAMEISDSESSGESGDSDSEWGDEA
ncbi:unnamed protein product [Cyprideis torosa]|uniref:Wiskott-Aldrich syndrome protein family member n=1 Tax=Cyprideis torosa TaxID=163714 RepID=A0A7R8W5T1_9CRUS|nr:unnamed protein product [Cyprideis torosa]CAG0885654.1 unnamed protein product [Cyprideis torosa]